MKWMLALMILAGFVVTSHAKSICLVSYNIRYDGSGDKGPRDWQQRKDKVTNYLRESHATVIGLQEVLHNQLLDVDKALPSHSFIGVGRDDAKQRGEYSPIFYDHKVWKVDPKENGTFWLSATPNKPGSKTWGNSIPRICTWARLIGLDGKGLYIFNSHWDHRSQPSREKAAMLILERIKARKHPKEPYILMGDLNANSDNPAIKTLLNSSLLIDNGGEQFKTFNHWQGARVQGKRIDHIFTSPSLHGAEFFTDANGEVPGSDHHPVRLLLPVRALASKEAINPTHVYIGTGANGIYTALLDNETGALGKATMAAEVGNSGFLALHPNKKYLYSTAQMQKGIGAVAAYSIEKDGSLTELGKQAVQGKGLCHITLDATSGMLMGANYGEGNVVSLPVNEDGSIGKLASIHQHEGSSAHPQRQTKPHAHSIYSGPDNKYAYAPDLGIDKIMIYAIDPKTAKLTASGSADAPAGAGPRHMKFGKDGKQAYVLNELTVDISVYDRDAGSGKLTSTQVVSTLPEGADKTSITCSEIRVSKDGKFIYCANRDLTEQKRDSISVFSVGDGGKLTRIQTIGAEVWIPRNINLDPSGKWLLVAGQRSNNVPVFKVDTTTGKLSHTGHQIEVPKAMCVEFLKK
ncbi:hypothetical protein NT6N_27540 [Oceaniferula spumae]|uniref:Endonuclease/exonuclease/phosphatase domain-containing protein n=1 Tax=Oceaniferula spumae TaxID=2979115 RepID=A0AAT9FP89_9BACT